MGMALSYIAGAVSVVCWIIVLIRMFRESVLKGILGLICGLYAFIWGWMNSGLLFRNIMLIWTAAIVLGIVSGFVVGFPTMP